MSAELATSDVNHIKYREELRALCGYPIANTPGIKPSTCNECTRHLVAAAGQVKWKKAKG